MGLLWCLYWTFVLLLFVFFGYGLLDHDVSIEDVSARYVPGSVFGSTLRWPIRIQSTTFLVRWRPGLSGLQRDERVRWRQHIPGFDIHIYIYIYITHTTTQQPESPSCVEGCAHQSSCVTREDVEVLCWHEIHKVCMHRGQHRGSTMEVGYSARVLKFEVGFVRGRCVGAKSTLYHNTCWEGVFRASRCMFLLQQDQTSNTHINFQIYRSHISPQRYSIYST